jgi:non-ribosomal peptide synthetase component F
MNRPSTITQLFAQAVAEFAGRPAVCDDAGHSLTYAELDHESAKVARCLMAAGVGS